MARLNRRMQVAFGSAILTLLVVGAVSYRGIVASSESDRWVRHTHEVLENLHQLAFTMEAVEAGCRGFVLTGNESYFESYRAHKLSAQRDLQILRGLTVDNAIQQGRLLALVRLAAEKIASSETLIALRRSQGQRERPKLLELDKATDHR